MMLVRDHPLPVDFSQAYGQTKVERFGLTVGPRSLAAHARKSEGDIRASRDLHLLNAKANRAARPGKEQVPGFPVSVEPDASKRRRNIEHHEIGGMASQDPVIVPPAYGIRP